MTTSDFLVWSATSAACGEVVVDISLAYSALGPRPFLEVLIEREEFRAQALDLLAVGGARVERVHHAAQAARRSQWRASPPRRAHDEHARGRRVPAAVIVLGTNWPYSADASSTAR